LLYDHARSYDPVLGRFISPDTLVPGAGALTAAPHDATATTAWRSAATTGPQNPQEINRYSYALNNPMRYTDPSGQCVGPVIVYCVGVGAKALFDAATVVIGGYLIYDGMQQIAATGAGTLMALPIEGTGVAGASVGGAGELAGVTGAGDDVPLQAPPGTDVEPLQPESAARRAADRYAGWGKHGTRPPAEEEAFHDVNSRSKSPQGSPGTRTVWRDPKTGVEMHHDPYGNYYPETDTGVGPHYGVKREGQPVKHFPYRSKHNPRTNR
jgi:RHS repeat-associated protein